MNNDLIMAYNYARLVREHLEKANINLILDTAIHEADTILKGISDDMELEAAGQNIRSNVITVNFGGQILRMTNNIIKLYNDAPGILRAIADEEPKNVFVIAWPNDGSMPTYHSSTSDTPVVLMRLQEFIHKYYNGDFSTE